MRRKKRRVPHGESQDESRVTWLQQKPSIYNAIIEGVEKGLSYADVARAIGVHATTLSDWMNRARKAEQEMERLGLSTEQIDEIGANIEEIKRGEGEWEKEYGEGVISLVRREALWIGFAFDLRKADALAEGRMLGVIRDAAIGNHALVETRRKTVVVKKATGDGEEEELPGAEVITTTKQQRPQWQAAAWFLERKYPEKYAQRRIVQGELPPDIPYEVFMTAKTLLQLPKIELDRIIKALKEKMQAPRIASAPVGLIEEKKGGNGKGVSNG
jgi:hypothetical protein